MSLGRLVVSLTADVSEFVSEIGRAAHVTERTMNQIKRSADSAANAIGLMFAAGVGTAAVFVKQAINTADAMFKMAQSAGVTTESLSGLDYVAKLSGVSTENLGTALGRLNRNIADTAVGTGEAKDAFLALGVSVRTQEGELKNADQVLLEVADKFSMMQDGAGKSALAIQLFGRAGAQLIPMLNQGRNGIEDLRAEAERLGIVISTETGRAAEEFNDNLTRLGKAVDGLKFSLAKELLPRLGDVAREMANAAREGEGFLGVLKALAALSPATDLFKTQREIVQLTDELLQTQNEILRRGQQGAKRDEITALEEHAIRLETRLKELVKLRGVLSGETDIFGGPVEPKEPPKLTTPQLVDKAALAEELAGIRAFVDLYSGAVKLGTALVAEAEKQGLVTHLDVLQQRIAANNAILAVEINALRQREAIHRKLGELDKAREVQGKIAAAEAQQQANDLIGRAQLATLEKVENEKAAARADAFNRSLSQSVAAIELETMTEREMLEARLEEKQAILDRALAFKMVTEEDHRRMTEDLELQHQARLGDITAQAILARRKFEQKNMREQAQTIFGELASITAGVAQHNRTLFNINKAAGIATAILKAYEGISRTLGAYPFPFNIAMAAAHAAVAFAQVSAIRGQSFGGSGAAPSLAGGTAAPPVSVVSAPEIGPTPAQPQPALRQVNIYVQGRSITRDQLEEIADGLNELNADGFPVRFTVAAVS